MQRDRPLYKLQAARRGIVTAERETATSTACRETGVYCRKCQPGSAGLDVIWLFHGDGALTTAYT